MTMARHISSKTRRRIVMLILGFFLSSLVWKTACAHEVEATRLSLVQREPSHVAAAFYASVPDYFSPVLNGPIAKQDVLLHLASLNDEAFAALYAKSQSYYKQHISFALNKDKQAQLSDWQFTPWQTVRTSVQMHLAQQLVSPNAHAHLAPVQFNVQLTSRFDVSVLQPSLPSHWGKVLVVASKPQQVWMDATKSSPWIKF